MERTNILQFGAGFSTFEDWYEYRNNSEYSQKIKRLHELHPKASLSQLRRHPRRGEKPLGDLKPRKISQLSWEVLTPVEKDLRIRSREVYRLMQQNRASLSQASNEIGISRMAVLENLDGLKKVNGRYVPKSHYKNEVPMNINTNGESIYILVKDSRHASTIGRYQNAVKQFLEHQDVTILAPFVGKSITDSKGTRYVLETEPSKLYEIRERREDEEFYSIYGG